jgi:cytochrome oxidase assembly protein ShyY1
VRSNSGEPGALDADWKIVNVSPQKHQAYAVQWFAMAFALLVFYTLRSSNVWQVITRSAKVDE